MTQQKVRRKGHEEATRQHEEDSHKYWTQDCLQQDLATLEGTV